MAKPKRLPKGVRVVSAYAERAAGPGWANSPVWVIVRHPDHSLTEVCLQPEDHSARMSHLYSISAEVHSQMKAAAREMLERQT